ncbi:MAG: DNA-3-methyladenine glycosylase family protein [Myxococcota bacterium]
MPPQTEPWAHYAAELASRDEVMAQLARHHGPPVLDWLSGSSFECLARTIVFQQLAGAAAEQIWRRLQREVGRPFTAPGVLRLSDERLEAAGLSRGKCVALRDLSSRATSCELPLRALARMSDDDVTLALLQVKGIGPWTAEMFLLFKLRRPDVWPVADLGVRKGYQRAYSLPDIPTPRELKSLGEAFRPYRSVAAWYLWRAASASKAS